MNDKSTLALALIFPIILIAGFALMVTSSSDLDRQQDILEEPIKLGEEKNSQSTQSQDMQQELQINPNKMYTANLTTTEGSIKIQLNSNQTPITVNNFVTLANKGFYNNTIFHRVIKGFMIQGGDPVGDGTGGPGYKFADEPFEGEYTRGTIAMANAGPNTNGSQFFIMHQDYPLPKNYVIFGKVVEGLDVVDKIAEAQTTVSGSGENSKPIKPVSIINVSIEEK